MFVQFVLRGGPFRAFLPIGDFEVLEEGGPVGESTAVLPPFAAGEAVFQGIIAGTVFAALCARAGRACPRLVRSNSVGLGFARLGSPARHGLEMCGRRCRGCGVRRFLFVHDLDQQAKRAEALILRAAGHAKIGDIVILFMRTVEQKMIGHVEGVDLGSENAQQFVIAHGFRGRSGAGRKKWGR